MNWSLTKFAVFQIVLLGYLFCPPPEYVHAASPSDEGTCRHIARLFASKWGAGPGWETTHGIVAWTRRARAVFRFPKARENLRREAIRVAGVPEETAEKALPLLFELDNKNGSAYVGLLWRLKSAIESGERDELRKIFKVIPFSFLSPDDLPFPTLLNNPVLAKEALQARDNFLNSPENALSHIVSGGKPRKDTVISGLHIIPGGMHTISEYERLLDLRIQDREKADSGFATAMKKSRLDLSQIDRNDRAWARTIEDLESMGFESTPQGLLRFLIGGEMWGRGSETNGVVRIWNDRFMFRSQAWEQTEGSATQGFSPAGGKTLFPKSWDEKQISKAISLVLESPQTRIVRVKDSGAKRYLLENTVDGVRMTVAVTGQSVVSAYPSWRQRTFRTVADGYAEWASYHESALSVAEWVNEMNVASRPITLAEAKSIYLGRKVDLPEVDLNRLKELLNPESSTLHFRKNEDQFGSSILTAKAKQRVLFQAIELDRILGEFETNATNIQ